MRHLHRQVYGRTQNSNPTDVFRRYFSHLFYDALSTSGYKMSNVKMSDVGESGPISTE